MKIMFHLPQAGSDQEISAQERAPLLGIGRDPAGHIFQGLPLEIPGQVPMLPSQPRSQGEVASIWVPEEVSNGGGYSGG